MIARWLATVTYRTDGGTLDVERGPSFEAIQDIRITYEATGRAITIEAAEKE